MKQMLLFDGPSEQQPKGTPTHYWKLYVDGASRNNPGLAGAGIYILKDDVQAESCGYFLGSKTNNQAEYLALLLGLLHLNKHRESGDMVLIVSDSQLLVRQLEGQYKVKHPDLKPLFALAKTLLLDMNYDVAHVLREDNTKADAMANKGIDTRKRVPQEFITLLEHHGISL